VGLNIGYVTTPQFDEAIASMPCANNAAFSAYWLGQGHLDMGLFDQALAHFNAALSADPEYRMAALGIADVRLAMAEKALANGEWDSGLELVEQAIADYAQQTAYGGLADALLVKADLLDASGQRHDAWIARKSAAKALLDWGRTWRAYEVAQDVWEQMRAAEAPVDPDVAWLLGKCNVLLHGRGEGSGEGYSGPSMSQADDFFAKALAADETHVPTLLDRGRMYLSWGASYDPDVSDPNEAQAQKQWRITWIGYAVDDLRGVTLHEPGNPEGWIELGNAYMAWSYRGENVSDDERTVSRDQLGKAINHFTRAIQILRQQGREMDPVMGQVFLKLATCHRRIGRIDEAVDAAWNAQAILGEEDPQPWIELIFIFVEGNDYDKARETYADALEAVPGAPAELKKLAEYIDTMEEKYLESDTDFRPHQWPGRRSWPPE
jgi:tetratricopeptide (TPR) repeat protein